MEKEELIQNFSSIAKKSNNLASDLLLEIDQVCQAIPQIKSLSTACNPFALEIIGEIKDQQERKRIRDAIKRLKKKELIKINKKGDQMVLSLTKTGKIESLRSKIICCEDQLPGDECCIVSFDVPEDVRLARDKFRKFLKSAGFNKLHRSVWVSNLNIVDLLIELIKMMKVGGWISVFCGRRLI